MKLKFFLFLFLTLILTTYDLILPVRTYANMKSTDYELQMPNFNLSAGNIGSTDFKLGFTAGQNMPGPYAQTGTRLLAGFWYLKSIIPFSFTVSNQVIDFGVLEAEDPKTAATTLTVSAGGAGGYQVTAQENHQPLVDSIGAFIPDTAGDDGDITESHAGTWANATTYGFGYTLYGHDVPTPFPTAGPAGDTYKQFTDTSKNEDPEVVMISDKVGRNRTATLTYKVNVSSLQSAGRYHNVIMYIATPTY